MISCRFWYSQYTEADAMLLPGGRLIFFALLTPSSCCSEIRAFTLLAAILCGILLCGGSKLSGCETRQNNEGTCIRGYGGLHIIQVLRGMSLNRGRSRSRWEFSIKAKSHLLSLSLFFMSFFYSSYLFWELALVGLGRSPGLKMSKKHATRDNGLSRPQSPPVSEGLEHEPPRFSSKNRHPEWLPKKDWAI